MVRLSRGGSDAAEIREFDTERKTFVEDGFLLPEARTFYEWKDANALYVATDFGEGSTTETGLPQVVKEWQRGTPLSQATMIFETDFRGAWAFPIVEWGNGRHHALINHRVSRYETIRLALNEGRLQEIPLPRDARIRINPGLGTLVTLLASDWSVAGATYPEGAVLSIDYEGFLTGDRQFEVVFLPEERAQVLSFSNNGNLLLVNTLRDAAPRLLRYRRENERWTLDPLATPEHVNTLLFGWIGSSDQFFFTSEGFLTPPTLNLAREDGTVIRVRQQAPQFDAGQYTVSRNEATSPDGTRIPYFLVHRRDMVSDGANPALLDGYGGYGISRLPQYDPTLGAQWLERGGVYALANIRGGSELGPSWHRAAQRENRQRAFDDFVAVAEDLIARGISSPQHLGIMGHSNGGLLVGAVLTQRPELFKAVVALNPLLDLSQVSDRDELGDAEDPRDWEYMKQYSPYHNLSPQITYPEVLFVTSTTDDRAPPGDARKMAARMEDMGHPVSFYEVGEGTHGGGVTLHQQATRDGLIFAYLLDQLRGAP
jgi:prolyl oligopeptidase